MTVLSVSSPPAEAIVGISTNFTIGFGSFVDKCLAPFVNIDPNLYDDIIDSYNTTQQLV